MKNTSVLQTKLNRPRLGSHLINRPHLRERLEQGATHKLSLICAPAGYGKSTLGACWSGNSSRPAAWLSLDETDDDLYRFLTYITHAIHKLFPDSCPETLNLLQAPQNPPIEHLSITLINEIATLKPPFILVLDDYQLINQNDIHQFITQLTDQVHTQMQLVIISRKTPPLSIPRLRANREVLEIRPHHLQFSVSECAELLEQSLGTVLPTDIVELLTARTEGWIAGLWLAAFSLRDQADHANFVKNLHGTNHYIMEYLVDEIIKQQSQAIQTFLLQTSILDRLYGPLCDALTGNDDPMCNGQAYLNWLHEANFLITPLDQDNQWYRYHALLRDLLHHKLLTETPAQAVAMLHRKAAEWLATNGQVEEALQHFLAADDTEAAALLVENNRHYLLDKDNWRMLEHCLALLPAELIQTRPGLLMAQAHVLQLTHKMQAVPALVQATETLIQAPSSVLTSNEAPLIKVELDFFRGVIAYWQTQGRLSFNYLQQALAHMPPHYNYLHGLTVIYYCISAQMNGQPDLAISIATDKLQNEVSPDDMLTVRLLSAQLLVFLTAGELNRFMELTEHVLKLSKQNHYVNMYAWGHYLLGYGYYIWNDLERAVYHLKEAVKLRYNQNIRAAVDSLALLATTYQTLQQPDQAKQTLALLLDLALQSDNPAFMAIAHSCHARLSLQQDNPKAATNWLQNADITLDKGAMAIWFELPRLTYCRVLISQNTTASLQEVMEKLTLHLKSARETHNTVRIIEILILQSVAYNAQMQVNKALATLKEAVLLAEPGGFIRNFVDCGTPVANLLRQLFNQDVAPNYINQILAAFSDLQAEANLKNLVEPLTERELEILEMLSKRLSNKEIASSLVISIPTVKSHTSHIYQKLAVNSRYQAVNKAKTLNLLSN